LSSMFEEKVIIRRAGVEDINSLTALLKVLFSIEEDFVFNEKRQQQGLKLMLENASSSILVAEINKVVVGMCSGQLTISTAEGTFSLLVEDVVVEEAWRGNGIAKKMLGRLAEWASSRGAGRMQLLADRNNGPALYYYTREGWQPTQLICLRKYNR
jgi:GNAT superfamily N-acetyltransferase